VQLGQASLQVFCVHLLFTFAGLTLLGHASMLSAWQQIALLAATLAGMLLTAKVFSKSEAKVERKGDGSPGPPQLAPAPVPALPGRAEARLQLQYEVSAALPRHRD
jgi:hypothetical protein